MRYFTLFLSIFILSCSNDYDQDTTTTGFDKSEKSAGDGSYDLLGYGYDVTKPYVSDEAVPGLAIIDIKKMILTESPSLAYYDSHYLGNIESRIFGGEDYHKYIEDILSKTNFSGSVGSNGISSSATSGMFSVNVKRAQSKENKHTYSSAYAYATAQIIKNEKNLFIEAEPAILSKYLSPYFEEELSKVNTVISAYQLVEKFGTHVLFNITIGGEFKSEFKSLSVENSHSTSKKTSAEIGAKYTLSSIGLGVDVGWDKESLKQTVDKNLNWKGTIKSRGGSTNGLTISINQNAQPNYSISVGTWASSVNDKTSRLISFDWNKTLPIYDLVTNPTKKNLIQRAVNTYLTNNIPEKLETAPLHRYWNGKHKMFYPTIVHGEQRMTSDWKYEGMLGYINKNHKTGTTPLYRYWNERHKMFYLTTIYGEQRMTSDWKYEGSLGYIQASQSNGMVPLYRYWNSRHKMFYFTTINSDPRMTNDWTFEGELGYVYPSDLPCVDTDKYPHSTPTPILLD